MREDDDDSQRRFFPPDPIPEGRGQDPVPPDPRRESTGPEGSSGRGAPPRVRAQGPVVLKVSSHSNPVSVAGALANEIRQFGTAEIRSVGAGALNQAVKAIAIARGYVAPQGIDLVCIPGFSEIEIDGAKKTALTFMVMKR